MPVEEISATTPVREISPYDKNAAQPRQERKRQEEAQPEFTPQTANTNRPATHVEPAMTANEAIGASVLPPASAPAQNEKARNNQYARQDPYPKEPMGKEQLPKVDANA